MEDKRLYWYNFMTGDYDFREAPQTDEEAERYIPQLGGVALYRIYREHEGLGIIEAMIKVLEKALGDEPK